MVPAMCAPPHLYPTNALPFPLSLPHPPSSVYAPEVAVNVLFVSSQTLSAGYALLTFVSSEGLRSLIRLPAPDSHPRHFLESLKPDSPAQLPVLLLHQYRLRLLPVRLHECGVECGSLIAAIDRQAIIGV